MGGKSSRLWQEMTEVEIMDQNIRIQSISTGDIKNSLNIEISKALYFVTFGFHSAENMNRYSPIFPNQRMHFSPPVRIERADRLPSRSARCLQSRP